MNQGLLIVESNCGPAFLCAGLVCDRFKFEADKIFIKTISNGFDFGVDTLNNRFSAGIIYHIAFVSASNGFGGGCIFVIFSALVFLGPDLILMRTCVVRDLISAIIDPATRRVYIYVV